jgi:carbamoyl-phosphate synthase large subunit
VLTALVLTFGSVWLGFGLLLDRWRAYEVRVVAATLHAIGLHDVRDGYANFLLVVPPRSRAFLATVTPSCSSLGAVLAFAAIALFLVPGSAGRRLGAFLLASMVVVGCNIVRIGLSIWVGVATDSGGLVLFHDWVGTAFGIFYVLLGFMAFLYVLLPSDRRLLKEMRRAA